MRCEEENEGVEKSLQSGNDLIISHAAAVGFRGTSAVYLI